MYVYAGDHRDENKNCIIVILDCYEPERVVQDDCANSVAKLFETVSKNVARGIGQSSRDSNQEQYAKNIDISIF